MFYSGLPVTQETFNEVAEVSGVMTFGEDFLPAAVRTECERIITECGWYQTHRCSTYISIFEGSLQPGALSLASRLFLIQLKRWNIESNKYNILNSYTRAVCGTLNTLSKSQSIKCMNFDYLKHTGFG